MIRVLVFMHVLFGCVAFAGMLGALVTDKGGSRHRLAGRAYVWGMLFTLVLALLVSALTGNFFLLLIGIFSGYFVFSGMRLAQARNGLRNQIDQFFAVVMMLVACLMLLYGVYLLVQGVWIGIAMMVFAALAFEPAWADYRRGEKGPTGKDRIVLHLNRMCGASIATVTAVFLATVQTSPALIGWLLPTFIGAPLIVYWTRRVLGADLVVPNPPPGA